jgi:hypothetical protein
MYKFIPCEKKHFVENGIRDEEYDGMNQLFSSYVMLCPPYKDDYSIFLYKGKYKKSIDTNVKYYEMKLWVTKCNLANNPNCKKDSEIQQFLDEMSVTIDAWEDTAEFSDTGARIKLFDIKR